MEADIVIVGAGPSGSMAALAAARGGLRVALIDKKTAVGDPVQCAEGVSRFAIESNGLRPDLRYVRQPIQGAQAVVPNGKRFDITRLPGYAVDRAAFDRSIADLAVDAGGPPLLPGRVTSMSPPPEGWGVRAHGKAGAAPPGGGAERPPTLVARRAGVPPPA